MSFDPITFISSSTTQNINTSYFFGFHFESQYSNQMWSEFANNFFVTPLSEASSHSGSFNSVVIGCCGEILSQRSFIISDLKLTNVIVNTSFTLENLNPGNLVILNCPKACQSSKFYLKVQDEKQLFIVGKVPGFAICERFGHYHSCSKFVDKTQNRLCHFHTVYYRLKALAMKRTPLTASELQAPKFHRISKLSSTSSSLTSNLSMSSG